MNAEWIVTKLIRLLATVVVIVLGTL